MENELNDSISSVWINLKFKIEMIICFYSNIW